MKTWIIEPRDSLIVRDGRPFGVGAGIRARSLDFPFPSATTGGVRTRAGLNPDGMFDTDLIDAVKQVSVKGPLLVELDTDGRISDWLMPAPADALIVGPYPEATGIRIKRLGPIADPSALTNLENGLLPIGMTTRLKGKPRKGPNFWYWSKFKEWLLEPKEFAVDPKELGHDGPEKDSRVHAGLNDGLTTGETGENNLFQTRGLEFRREFEYGSGRTVKRLGLAVLVDDAQQAQNIRPGLAPLGGERRLVTWREEVKNDVLHCPAEIRTKIASSRYCRLLFLTPAYFEQGSLPDWILRPRKGVTPVLKAIALNHYQVVSGWDFSKVKTEKGKRVMGEPKPTRRLVPPGAVLFLELSGPASVENWVDDIWFQCVSDDDALGPMNPRKDGFGLAVLGSWDGTSQKME